MTVRLLREGRSSPGTGALASFLVAFLERHAFCLPHVVVQSTSRHLVQQMGPAFTWKSDATTTSVFTLVWIYSCFTSYTAFDHPQNIFWASNMWQTVVVQKLNTDRNPDCNKFYSKINALPEFRFKSRLMFFWSGVIWSGNPGTLCLLLSFSCDDSFLYSFI